MKIVIEDNNGEFTVTYDPPLPAIVHLRMVQHALDLFAKEIEWTEGKIVERTKDIPHG